MSEMNGLVEFLLARIAEDESQARTLQRHAQVTQLLLQDPKTLGLHIPGWHDWPAVEAMTTGVIADVHAKRRIVEELADDYTDGLRDARVVLHLLARPYTLHDDYREEWKP